MAFFDFLKQTKYPNEFENLREFNDKLLALLKMDNYISKREYKLLVNESEESYATISAIKKQDILSTWCKKYHINLKDVLVYLERYEAIDYLIKDHNENFVSRHLIMDKNYLDKVLFDDDPNIVLDCEQRKVVLSDEDYTLVIAGAGAGKTTTIEAKVKYLIEKQNIHANRILVISFTKKATQELAMRFKKIKVNPLVSTFHSIGNTIIKNETNSKYRVVSQGLMFDTIKDFLVNKLDDEFFIRKIMLFFSSYLNVPFDEKDVTLLFKTLSDDNITTLKSDLQKKLAEYQKKETKKHTTLNNEKVRSIDECRIANFLYINDIEYDYEPIYQYCFNNTIKPYCPDFKIQQNDKIIYLEHFGISEDGKNNRFTTDELTQYKKHINDKIKLHREHGTTLIYTFSKYNDGRDLIVHLEEELRKQNITLNKKKNTIIYKRIIENAEDKYFNKLIILICNFISKFKTNNYKASKFDEWKMLDISERTKLFLDICYQCYLVYENQLLKNNSIDFEDMINNASDILDEKIKKQEMLEYDYIFVDEYQDISMQRFNLCEKLSKASNAKIIAVGDDWQAIYRFSGSRIDLFTNFQKLMGYGNILKITNTYRNSQELIDIAGKFVMKNDSQIKKTLTSPKTISEPILLYTYDDSPKKDTDKEKGPFYRMGEAIISALDHIVSNCGVDKTVLFIGRYGYEYKNLSTLTDLFTLRSDNKIIANKYPKLKILFSTAHSSKGLGFDNVIIINGKDAILGFPSKIEDDPVMKLVIKDDEKMNLAEERRLFYVALTRTKNRVYLITPQNNPSSFILELKNNFSEVKLKGVELNPNISKNPRLSCPYCGYPLQIRSRRGFFKSLETSKLYVCSNDPEVCDFITNDLKGGKLSISKCPKCIDGYLIVKHKNESRFLGCTNYKKDGNGCNFTMNEENYSQDVSTINQLFFNNTINPNDLSFMNYNLKKFLSNIINTIYKCKKSNFSINVYTLADFMCGIENKTINRFNMQSYIGFGTINIKDRSKIFVLVTKLEELDILKIDVENYKNVILLKNEITDKDVVNIYMNLM